MQRVRNAKRPGLLSYDAFNPFDVDTWGPLDTTDAETKKLHNLGAFHRLNLAGSTQAWYSSPVVRISFSSLSTLNNPPSLALRIVQPSPKTDFPSAPSSLSQGQRSTYPTDRIAIKTSTPST